jgi:hypothetical protein
MEDEDNMCSINIDGEGDYTIRGRNKDKCKQLLNDITFEKQ